MKEASTSQLDILGTAGGAPLRDALEPLRQQVELAVRELTRAKRAFSAAWPDVGSSDLDKLDKLAEALRKTSWAEIAPEPLRLAAVAALDRHLEGERAKRRMTLVGALHRAAAAVSLEVVRLGAEPPCFEIAPTIVELDFDRDEARILFAREQVLSTALDPDAILRGRVEAMDRIRAHGLEPLELFELLRRAYAMLLAANGQRAGERVELVDLLAPLALLAAGPAKWRKLDLARVAPFTRYQLAYYLQRLRREGLLAHDGARLDLGTATGGTTRNKRNVVFVPSGQDEGQYYLSLRFV